ncbi:MAG: hypothetical protein CMP10_04800 [Zetaproteobacteria bacterium]|nr:hypothetical protein [Pseudobdellovibrionaceae bacterium]|tara:strand:- start:44 stop:277 length:234 start_codon:yes stop_codon:yes gene_type:complete
MELPKLSKQLNLFEGDHSQQSFEWQRLCHDNSLMTTALEKIAAAIDSRTSAYELSMIARDTLRDLSTQPKDKISNSL